MLRSGALATTTLDLVGLELALPAAPLQLPRNAPFFVPVTLGLRGQSLAQASAFYPSDAVLQGILTGPALSAPVSLSGTLATGLSVPGLPEAGDYTISGVKLVRGSQVILNAQPATYTVHCLGDVLLTSVSASPMTMDEIKQAGIHLEPGDYVGRRFEMTLSVGGQQISLNVPIAIPVYNGLEDPRHGGGGTTGLQIGNIQGNLPGGLSVVLADIVPEKDPFTLSRPGLSFQMRNNFKALLVVPGSIGYLKQIYKVNVAVFNTLDPSSRYRITHLSATWLPPMGLDGMPGTPDDPLQATAGEALTQAMVGKDGTSILAGGQTAMATFSLIGNSEGSHPLDFKIVGQFEGGDLSQPVALTGTAHGKVLVQNPNFNLMLVHPDVVRRGQTYILEAHLTNTSQTLANAVSLTIDKARLAGAQLIGDATQTVDTLLPGQTVVMKFKLQAFISGQVTSSYLYIDPGNTIGFQLSTGIGPRDVRLNPDTLSLPDSLTDPQRGLPKPLQEAMLALLDAAYDVATSQKALPSGVLPISRSTITTTMAQELSQEGLFLGMGLDRARVWWDLWQLFTRNADPGFDQLVRTTQVGAAFRNNLLAAWSWADGFRSPAERVRDFATFNAGLSGEALVGIQGVGPGLHVTMDDGHGGSLRAEIPTSNQDAIGMPALGRSGAAWSAAGDSALLQFPMTAQDTIRFVVTNQGTESQSLTLGLVNPTVGTGVPVVSTLALNLDKGASAVLELGPSRTLVASLTSAQGDSLGHVTAATTGDAPAEPFQVLGVHRYDLSVSGQANPYGTQVMILFNRPNASLNVPEGEAGFQAASALVQVEANQFWQKVMPINPEAGEAPPAPAALLQTFPRVVSCYLEKPVGPYIHRSLTLSSQWTDRDGHSIQGPLQWDIQSGLLPGGAVVKGHFRRLDGTGVPGRLTYWYQQRVNNSAKDLSTGNTFDDEGIDFYYPLITNNVATGPDGAYQLDYVPAPIGDYIGPFVLQGGFPEGTAFSEASVLGNGQTIQMDLVLEGKGAVDGYVLDAQGQPIEGAQVLAIQQQRSSDFTQSTGGGSFSVGGITDARGHYHLEGLKTGIFSLQVLKDDLGAVSGGQITTDGQVVNLNVVLQGKVGTIRARILDPHGLLRMDQAVRLGIPAGLVRNGTSAGNWTYPVEGKPGSDGWVTFTKVPAGDVQLMAPYSAPTPAPTWQGFLNPGQTLQIELKMADPDQLGSVQAMVVDALGNPVPDASMKFDNNPYFMHFVAQTGPDGLTPPVPVVPGTTVTGYIYHPNWVGFTATNSVEVQAGGKYLLKAVMPARCTLTGRVTHSDGTPVAGAYVALPPVFNDNNRNRLGITDANGIFRILNVPAGASYRLAAVGPDLRTAVNLQVPVAMTDTALTVNLVLPDVAHNTLAGTVYQPLSGGGQRTPTNATVLVYGQLPSVTPGDTGNDRWGLPENVLVGAVSEEDMPPTRVGQFSIPNLPAGPYTLTASSSLFPSLVTATGDFGTATSDSKAVDIYLHDNLVGLVQGKIVLPDGQTPVAPGARVMVMVGGKSMIQVTSQAGGTYVFPKVLPPNDYYALRVEDPQTGDITVQPFSLKAQEIKTLNLRLWGWGDLTVQVQDSQGHPLTCTGAVTCGTVTLQHSKSNLTAPADMPLLQLPVTPADQGILMFPHLLEGPITVQLKDPSGFSGVASAEIPVGGGNQTVVVRLQPVGRIQGTLLRADGTPVAAGRVDAYQGGRWLGTCPTFVQFPSDPNPVAGHFIFDPLPTGPIRLEAWDPDSRQTGQATVNVEANQTTVLTMKTLDTGQVTVQVLQEGKPVLRAGIEVAYSGGPALQFSTQATADENGVATFILPPGSYFVQATDPVSLASGTLAFTRDLNQAPFSKVLSLQPVRSIFATVLPPPAQPGQPPLDLTGWRLRAEGLDRSVVLDFRGQGTLPDMPIGTYSLVLTDAANRFRGRQPFQVTVDGGMLQSARFQATAIGSVLVTVVDADGKPVSGATVTCGAPSLITDVEGHALFHDMGQGTGSLRAGLGNQQASGTYSIDQENQQAAATLTFAPTGALHGVVRDALGHVMPFLAVACPGVAETATDASGAYTLRGLPLGKSLTVVATAAEGRVGVSTPVTLGRGDDLEVDITLPPVGMLAGQVTDALRPTLPSMGIQVLNANGQRLASTSSDQTGAFQIPNLPANQPLTLSVVWDDEHTEALRETFTLPGEGQTINLQLPLPPFVNLTGWTLDSTGSNLPMIVRLLDGTGSTMLATATTTVDIPTFYFRYLKAGVSYQLLGLDPAAGSGLATMSYTPSGSRVEASVNLQRPAPHPLRLEVVYPDGSHVPGGGHYVVSLQGSVLGHWEGDLASDGTAAIADAIQGPARIEVRQVPGQPTLSILVDLAGPSQEPQVIQIPAFGVGEAVVSVRTASGRLLVGGTLSAHSAEGLAVNGTILADGTYLLQGLLVGRSYTLSGAGFGTLGPSPTLSLNRHGESVSITYPAPDQGNLVGTVVDSKGLPAVGAVVSMNGGTSALTDGTGQFRFGGVPLGGYRLVVTLPGRLDRAEVEGSLIQDGESKTQDIALKGVGSVKVSIVTMDGTPMPGQSVSIRNVASYAAGFVRTAVSGPADGEVTFPEVLEGPIQATANLEGQVRTVSGTLSAGGNLSLRLLARDATTLSGHIHRASGLAWPVGTKAQIGGWQFDLAGDGTLVVPDPAKPFEYTPDPVLVVAVLPSGRSIPAGSMTLVKNAPTVLNLSAQPYGTVRGILSDASGKALPGGTVSCGNASTTTGGDGSYVLDGLPMGTIALKAVVAGRSEWGEGTATLILDGDSKTVNLSLKGLGRVNVRVLDASGQSLQGLLVSLRNTSPNASDQPWTSSTDADGTAGFPSVVEGTVHAEVEIHGRTFSQEGMLNAGGTLSLTIQETVYTAFSGRIKRADASHPWPVGSRLQVLDQSYALLEDGTIQVPNSSPQVAIGNGSIQVFVSLPHGLVLDCGAVMPTRNGTTTLDLVAPPFGRLSVRVTNGSGSPVPFASVNTGTNAWMNTDTQGRADGLEIGAGITSVSAKTNGLVGATSVQLTQDGQDVTCTVALQANAVSLPVPMALPGLHLQNAATSQVSGQLSLSWGGDLTTSLTLDGVSQTWPQPVGAVAQWVEKDRQLSYHVTQGPLEITVLRTIAPPGFMVREEYQVRNHDTQPHQVALRQQQTWSQYNASWSPGVAGYPSGAAQPVMGGSAPDLGVTTTSAGSMFWGDGPEKPVACRVASPSYYTMAITLDWATWDLAPGEVRTIALAYAPYGLTDTPAFRAAGVSRMASRLQASAPEWTYGQTLGSWSNWKTSSVPAIPLPPWNLSGRIALQDALGRIPSNVGQLSWTYEPDELLAPKVSGYGAPTLQDLPGGGQLKVVIPRSGQGMTSTIHVDSLRDEAIRLLDAASLSVQLSGPEGHSVSGSYVTTGIATPGSCDEQGHAGPFLQAPGAFNVTAILAGSNNLISASSSGTAEAGQDTPVNLTFPSTGSVRLNLLDASGNAYVGGFTAILDSQTTNGQANAWNVYGTNGQAAWPLVLPGDWNIRVIDPRGSGIVLTIPVHVASGNETVVQANLASLGQVQVGILTPAGVTVQAGLSVTLGTSANTTKWGNTDASGQVIFKDVPSGPATVTVTNPANGLPSRLTVQVVGDQVVAGTLRLAGAGTLRFSLVNAAGQPIQGRSFFVTDGTQTYGGYYDHSTDASGVVTISGLPTGLPLFLRDMQAHSIWSPTVPDQAFAFQNDQETKNLNYALPAGDLLITVHQSGTPAPWVSLKLSILGNAAATQTFTTDGQGKVLMRLAPSPATYSYSVRSKQGEIAMSGGSQSVVIDLPDPVSLTVTLKRANGGPLPTPPAGTLYQGWIWHADPGDGISGEPSMISGATATWNGLDSGSTQVVEASIPLNSNLWGWGFVQNDQTSSEHWRAQGTVKLENATNTLILTLAPRASAFIHFQDPAGQDMSGTMNGDLISVQMVDSTNPSLVGKVTNTSSLDGLNLGEVLTEGIHHAKLSSAFWGDLGTITLTVGPGDDGKRLDIPVTLPWYQQEYRLQAVASDGSTPVPGVTYTLDSGLGTATLGTSDLQPLAGSFWAPKGKAVSVVAQFITPLTHQAVSANKPLTTSSEVWDQTLDLPVSVIRGRLKDVDGTYLSSVTGTVPEEGQANSAQRLKSLVSPQALSVSDAPPLVVLPTVSIGGETFVLLLGETPGRAVELTLFDRDSGLGQIVQTTVPPLGPALGVDASMPTYGWMKVPTCTLPDGTRASSLDLAIASADPGLVSPGYAHWQFGVFPFGGPGGGKLGLAAASGGEGMIPVSGGTAGRLELLATGAIPFRASVGSTPPPVLSQVRIPVQGSLWVAQAKLTFGEIGAQFQAAPWAWKDYGLSGTGQVLEEAMTLGTPPGVPVAVQVVSASQQPIQWGVDIYCTSPKLPASWAIGTRFNQTNGSSEFTGVLPALPSFRFYPQPWDLKDYLDWVVPTPLPVGPLILPAPHFVSPRNS